MNKVWIGVDGGGTKTEALLVSDEKVLAFSRGGPSNHQIVGMEASVGQIVQVIQTALSQGSYSLGEISGMVLGLAGADFPEDYARLRQAMDPFFSHVPYRIVNDAEIALRAGSVSGYGVVAIAGTGGNVLGLSPAGEIRQVGGLGYEWGDFGSGIDLAREVLHYAFRSAERRGRKTQLESLVLSMLGMKDYATLSRALYFHEIPAEHFWVLAPLCFQAAAMGDLVAKDILREMGVSIAESVLGCARLLNMDIQPVEVIMAGSLWLGVSSEMKDAFMDYLAVNLPQSHPHLSELRPVAGAAFMAVKEEGIPINSLRSAFMADQRLTGAE